MNFHVPSSGGNNWSSPFVGQVQPSSSHYYSLVEIRPFEPREFPLSEDTYRNMQKEDQKQVNILIIWPSLLCYAIAKNFLHQPDKSQILHLSF